MSFLPSNPNWMTPGRHTRLVLDLQGPVALRPSWSVTRRARQIAASRTAAASSQYTALQPGGAWTLKPFRDDTSRVLDSSWGGAALRVVDVNLGSHWGEVATFAKPTDLTGLGASGSLVTTGSYAFYKQVPAGSSWNSHLAADAAAFPQPTLESADIPMDRVLSSTTTYPTNAPFQVVFRLPPGFNQIDTLFTFYFGGPNTVTPTGTQAGQFALTVRGSGKAILQELQGGGWVTRLEFNAFTGLTGNLATATVRVFPYGPDTIAVTGGSVDGEGSFSGPYFGQFLPGQAETRRFQTFYRNNPAVSGYRTGGAMTGAGTVRLDVRRDLRTYVQILHLLEPASGTLVDLPFWIPFPVAGGTVLKVTGNYWLPRNTALSVQLYDADTDVALTPVSTTAFLSVGNQQAYYAKFGFAADPSQQQTPVLYRYQVDVPVLASAHFPVSITGGALRHVSITGPDLDPAQETASVNIQDPKNELAILRVRGRIPGRLAVFNDAGVLTSILFEGEVNLATATRRGRPGHAYPSPLWHEYDCQMVGQWAKLAEHINLALLPYDQDPQGRINPDTSTVLPWRVTDIIRDLLYRIGYDDTQIEIPDIPIHLFAEAQNQEDFILQPTVGVGEFIKTLAEKYLAMTLIWDGNAGFSGMWRLLAQNVTGGPVLASFVGGPGPGRLAHHPNSYAPGVAFIEKDSYREEPRAPEGNYILVVGTEMTLPSQIASSMYNPVSFDFFGPTANPLHPDYMGRFVPIVHVDPTLTTRSATNFVCRRLYNFAAHGFLWLKWSAPLLFVWDPSDVRQTRPRPLRLQDAVYVLGRLCIIRSVNPEYEHDGVQTANYEGIVVS